ncbi:MAG TPA: hypothetical protein VMT34_12290 [Aggregatilineales bacterium]|nr:hypothetical protein [Aggregatilineales bacterium]
MKARYGIVIILSLILLLGTPQTGQAQSYYVQFTPSGAGSCSATGFSLPANGVFALAATPPGYAVVDAINGAVVYSANGGWFQSSYGSNVLFFVQGGGFPTGSSTYSFHRTFIFAYASAPFAQSDITFNCAGGAVTGYNISNSANSAPAVVVPPVSNPPAVVPGATPTYSNPGVPPAFVLRTIVCNVGVYETPNRNPVAGATIYAGQTWFVSPIEVPDENGNLWQAIYVGGQPYGYVPTSCIAGPPAH